MKNKSNSSQVLWFGLGSLTSFLMTIVSSIVLARVLSKSDFGTYRQILYVYNALLFLFTAGIPKAYTYFLPRFELTKQKDIVKKITVVLLILGAFFSISLYFLAPIIAELLNNPKLAQGIRIFSPIPLFLLPTLGIEGIYATLKRAHITALYQVISRVIQLLSILIPVLFYGGTYIEALYGWLISSFFLLLLGFAFKHRPYLSIKLEKSGVSYKDIFKYSLPIMVASIYGVGTQSADQFFISRYFGEEVFAVFANGKLQLPFVGMITGAVATALAPVYSKLSHNGFNQKEIQDLWKKSLLKSASLIYPLVLFFLFFATNVFVVLYGESYLESANYFRIFTILSFFQVITFAPLILGMGLTKFYSRLHFFELVFIWSFQYIAFLIFKSPYAIAIVAVVISIVKILYALWYVSKKLEIPFLIMFPIRILLKYILHGVSILLIIKFIFVVVFNIKNSILLIVMSFVLYGALLLISGKWLKIDYLEPLRPFLKKVPMLKKIVK